MVHKQERYPGTIGLLWFPDPPVLFITHRIYGRLQITYPTPLWENFVGTLKLQFDIFHIPSPDADSSSDEDVVEGSIPGADAFPFYRAF